MSAALQALGMTLTRGRRLVLRDITLAVPAGRITALVGPNGAGKSTLLHALAGLLVADAGEVRIGERALGSFTPIERARKIALLPQRREAAWSISVEDAVAIGRFPGGAALARLSAQDRRAIADAMAQTDILALAGRRLDRLSGGEQARVLLARAFAVEAPILLADEPLAGLDPAHCLATMERLRQRAAKGDAVVIALHDLSLVARYADQVAVLYEGALVTCAAPAAALDDAILARVFGIRAARFETHGETALLPWSPAAGSCGATPENRE
jgi:iron complex transport system ATP-binding protein